MTPPDDAAAGDASLRETLELVLPGADQAGRRAAVVAMLPRLAALLDAGPELDPSRDDPTDVAAESDELAGDVDGVAEHLAAWCGPERQAIDLDGVAVLERIQADELLEALETLLAVHVAAALPRGSFASWVEPADAADTAWRRLERARGERDGMPAPTRPGETPLQVAERLLRAAGELGMPEHVALLWEVRRVHAAQGPRAALEVLASRASLEDPAPADRALRRSLLASEVELLLELRACASAADTLDLEAELVASSRELLCAQAYARIGLGDLAGARDALLAAGRTRGPWPEPVAELAGDDPAFARLLGSASALAPSSRAITSRAGTSQSADVPEPRPPKVAERRQLGAAVVAVFRIDADAVLTCVHLDVAPGCRDATGPWLDGRRDALRDAASPERQVVVRASLLRRHLAPLHEVHGVAPQVWTGPERRDGCVSRAHAVALVPIPDARGEVAGILRLEFEHHLLPSSCELHELAAGLAPRLTAGGVEPGDAAEVARPRHGPDDPLARAARHAIERIGAKLGRRRVWVFEESRGERRLVYEDGEALADWRAAPGEGRALERARRSGGPVRFERSGGELGLARDSASGIAIPLLGAGAMGCQGYLVLESTRVGDVSEETEARWTVALAGAGEVIARGRFAAWQRRVRDVDVDTIALWPGAVAELCAAARGGRPIWVEGPAGSGKGLLARWLGFLAPGEPAPELEVVRLHHDDLVPRGSGLGGGLPAASGAPLFLVGWERSTRLPEHLARAEELARAGRTVVLASCTGRDAPVPPAAARRLARWHLRLAPLAERRHQIPGLFATLLGRAARACGRPAPVPDADATALVWRQAWLGNARELEDLAAELVAFGTGEVVRADDLREVAARFGRELRAKLPSRHPPRALLEQALASSRCKSGRPNRRRAAALLGWNVDTLLRRLREAKLDAPP